MLKHKILLFFLVLIGVSFSYNYLDARTDCIPIRGSIFRPDDFERRKNIKAALKNIEKYSIEDYDRICNRSYSIDLTRFEEQWVVEVPAHALGAYYYNQKDHSMPGRIKIDRETADSYKLQLEGVLVHEACHSFQTQTLEDFSESPCEYRSALYYRKRPDDPIEERSAEAQKLQGSKFHTYCFDKGECVFTNYTTTNQKMCAKVFLKKENINEVEKQICAEVKPMGYKSVKFSLSPGSSSQTKLQFVFLVVDPE